MIMGDNTKDNCNALRADILVVVKQVNELRKKKEGLMVGSAQHAESSEVIANITLAYRCLEDARMRLGKAIQAFEGGESKYDTTPETVG